MSCLLKAQIKACFDLSEVSVPRAPAELHSDNPIVARLSRQAFEAQLQPLQSQLDNNFEILCAALQTAMTCCKVHQWQCKQRFQREIAEIQTRAAALRDFVSLTAQSATLLRPWFNETYFSCTEPAELPSVVSEYISQSATVAEAAERKFEFFAKLGESAWIESAVAAVNASNDKIVLVVGGSNVIANAIATKFSSLRVAVFQPKEHLLFAPLSERALLCDKTIDFRPDLVVFAGLDRHQLVGSLLRDTRQTLAPLWRDSSVRLWPTDLSIDVQLLRLKRFDRVCGENLNASLAPFWPLLETASVARSSHNTAPLQVEQEVTKPHKRVFALNLRNLFAANHNAIEIDIAFDDESSNNNSVSNAIGWSSVLHDSVFQFVDRVGVVGAKMFVTLSNVWFAVVGQPTLRACPFGIGYLPAWHFEMLLDEERNRAFADEIARQCKNRRVLDPGAGSGILCALAARAGASDVVGVEISPLIHQLATVSFPRRKFVRSNSLALTLSAIGGTKADLLLAELLDAGGLGEHWVAIVRHAKQHLLTKDAIIIPGRLQIVARLLHADFVDLVDADAAKGEFMALHLQEFEFRDASAPVVVFDFAMASDSLEMPRSETIEFGENDGNMICYWFETSSPQLSSNGGNHWGQAVARVPRGETKFVAETDGKRIRFLAESGRCVQRHAQTLPAIDSKPLFAHLKSLNGAQTYALTTEILKVMAQPCVNGANRAALNNLKKTFLN